VRFMEVGGSDFGGMPDRCGHALGVGQRASGVRGGFFRLREALSLSRRFRPGATSTDGVYEEDKR